MPLYKSVRSGGAEDTSYTRKRLPIWAIAAIAAGALAVLGLVAWLLLHPAAPAEESTNSIVQSSVVQYAPVQQQPEPEPEPEPNPVSYTLQFTDEETAQLDGMLAAWAAEGEYRTPATETAEGEQEPAGDEGEAGPTAYGFNVSVFFMDIDSGLTYIYNGEQKYLIASLNKAPYAVYLYHLVEEGKADLNETFYVTYDMLAGSLENTGRIKDDETLPREYTMAELIHEMLRYSDTGALRILLSRYPADGFAAYAEGLSLTFPEDIRSLTNARITALDAGAYLADMYDYMQNGVYGEELKQHFLNTRNAMIQSGYPVARKYGWDVLSYHDMAVVYTEHPYLLAILTDKSDGSARETAMFATIAATFEDIMAQKYSTTE